MHFPYVQDDIRVSDKLTVNLGLRYEYVTPFWERDNNASNFDPTTRSMIMASDQDRYLVDPDRNNFGPRLGFAFTPVEKTAVRGGYGINYTHVNRTGSADVLTYNPRRPSCRSPRRRRHRRPSCLPRPVIQQV